MNKKLFLMVFVNAVLGFISATATPSNIQLLAIVFIPLPVFQAIWVVTKMNEANDGIESGIFAKIMFGGLAFSLTSILSLVFIFPPNISDNKIETVIAPPSQASLIIAMLVVEFAYLLYYLIIANLTAYIFTKIKIGRVKTA